MLVLHIADKVGDPWRMVYVNSENGRLQVQNEVANPFFSAIMTVWGDAATVVETTL